MNLKNKDKAQELLRQRSEIERNYNGLLDVEAIRIRHIMEQPGVELAQLSYLSSDKLEKIRCEILGMMEQQIEEIDQELEKL